MCGIVGYIGFREAYPILIKGLKRLEYRGYDSAGIALLDGDLNLFKSKGRVSELEKLTEGKITNGSSGIGHTRWATHGEPNDVNAHPHFSQTHNLAIIHNGIIENYAPLKKELIARGFVFQSNTDTEVLIHLVEDIMENMNVDLVEALRIALNQVIGAYAIVIISRNHPDMLVAARKSSPLVIGLGEEEFFIASDAAPIVEYTKEVVYLNDNEIAVLQRAEKLKILTTSNIPITPYVQQLVMNLSELEKGGYDHFMLKEIFEQPNSIRDSIRGRLRLDEGIVSLGGILNYEEKLINARRIIIVGCGTSWHAGLTGEHLIEELARIPVEVEYASEFRYRNPLIFENDVVLAISQSGETADTLAAIELAKSKGATIIGICNVVGSSISRVTHAGTYTHAGPEIGVASTKAFTAQVVVLAMLALRLAYKRGTITASRYKNMLWQIEEIPAKVQIALKSNDDILKLAEKFQNATNALYLGRGINFPVALEGALKLKEISYIHAEGYPAAEMKHGPIALIDENMPVIVIATNRSIYEKVISNIQEVKARKGVVIAIANQGDTEIETNANYVISVPETDEMLSPLISTIPLQLLAYHIAVLRGCNVDQPRNLAKAVTVE